MRRHRDETKKVSCDPEALEKIIEELLEVSEEGAAIIVEGIRDERSLRDLGIEGTIIMAAQKPALDLMETVAEEFEEVVILTDWDRKGDELASKMELYLSGTRARANLEIRKRLKQLVRREIKDVESLSRLVERVREETCPSFWL